MHFASQATEKEPAVWFGFYEKSKRLASKAESLGFDFSHVSMTWQPATEHSLDAVGLNLFDAVCRSGVKRLIVDEIGPVQHSALFPERITARLPRDLDHQAAKCQVRLVIARIFDWQAWHRDPGKLGHRIVIDGRRSSLKQV